MVLYFFLEKIHHRPQWSEPIRLSILKELKEMERKQVDENIESNIW